MFNKFIGVLLVLAIVQSCTVYAETNTPSGAIDTDQPILTFRDEEGNILLTDAEILYAVATTHQTFGGFTEIVVQIEFTTEGTSLFSEVTRSNLGRQIFIYWGDDVISAPFVSTVITDGIAIISGDFTAQSAYELASLLRQDYEPQIVSWADLPRFFHLLRRLFPSMFPNYY